MIAAVAGLLVLGLLSGVVLVRRSSSAPEPLNFESPADPYAANLEFTQLAMSESTSLSGGKSTFIDGRVRNSGSDTVTGVTVQAIFRNNEGLPPTVVTLPLSLVRTHNPYLDTEAVSAAPLKPGNDAEFRLVCDMVPANWNQQMPDIHPIRIEKR